MSWNPLKKQKENQQAIIQQRIDAAKKQAELIAANPKPPLFPSGPMPDVSKGIAFGTRRVVGKGRKRKFKKTIRRSKK